MQKVLQSKYVDRLYMKRKEGKIGCISCENSINSVIRGTENKIKQMTAKSCNRAKRYTGSKCYMYI